MKKLFILFISYIVVFSMTSCKFDRIDHEDANYIYVWQYDGDDSTLVKFSQPIYVERNVMGGHHKNHHIKVDINNDGNYICTRIPYNINRCAVVNKAQEAWYYNKPIIAIFKESFYPYHELTFVRYK